ncbi:hypothetical protein GJQ57_23525 [Ralstonia pickettii]|uniref:Uncharacterized protein n=2 Tax=Burkholderiaceae TaxID=119060 RepID=A0A7X2HRV1_RALPI|nr:hypothetical protein [Ralstonia pickettii]
MRPTTFFVIRYKTLLMQRLLDAVRHGYHHYTSGQVPAEKALAFCQKFAERYDVALNRDQRAYRKRLGKGNARLVLADLAKSGVLHWFLLVSEGDHPARQQEPLRDALDSSTRIRVDDYELLRLPRDRKHGGGVRLTWRMTNQRFDTWRAAMRQLARSSRAEQEVPAVILSLFKTPGFSATRVQVGKLVAGLTGEWERAGRDPAALVLPPALPYVRRVADDDYTVIDWFKDQEEKKHGQSEAA